MSLDSATAKLIDHGSSAPRLAEISKFLKIQGIENPSTPQYNLHCHSNRLLLEDYHPPDKLAIQVDFKAGKMQWRRKQSERLHRALGINERHQPTIIDATAGLGQDAFIMASQGSTVTLLENNPLVYLILQDGIQQAVSAGDPAALRMTAIYADANAYLKSTNDAPHVVYLDPMFPDNKKSAKNKKEMQVLQNLVGHSTDDQDLLKLARATAVNRVVVKRPVKAKISATMFIVIAGLVN